MRLPRDVTGLQLAQTLKKLDYEVTRQTGSHIRLTTQQCGEHHITIPQHNPLRVGTFAAILNDISVHFGITKEQLVQKLFK